MVVHSWLCMQRFEMELYQHAMFGDKPVIRQMCTCIEHWVCICIALLEST